MPATTTDSEALRHTGETAAPNAPHAAPDTVDPWRQALEHSSDAIAWLDRQGEVHYANPALLELLDQRPARTREDAAAATRQEQRHQQHQQHQQQWQGLGPAPKGILAPPAGAPPWRTLFDGAMRGVAGVREYGLRRSDGSVLPVEFSLSPIVRRGYPALVCMLARDVTERNRQARELETLRHAIDTSPDPVLMYDRDARFTYANQAACDALRYSREELLSLRVMDINPVVDEHNWALLFEQVKEEGKRVIETVQQRKDGSRFEVEVSAAIIERGGHTYGFSYCRDITQRKRAERALRESEERFRAIADASPIALIISRPQDGRIIYANAQAEQLLGVHDGNGSTMQDLWARLEADADTRARLQAGRDLRGREMMFERADGTSLWLSVSTQPIELQGETVLCLVLHDVTEARELSRQLLRQATYDSLTGLVNRREFEARLKAVIANSPPERPNALCYLDLDQFKIINDTCGHPAGDELLRQLARTIAGRIRRTDTLARLGGDEFALLLEDCGLDQAERVARGVRQAVQELRFVWGDKVFNVGVSVGLVPVTGQHDTVTQVLQRADSACYAAKDRGRNRIHVFSADDEELEQRRGEMQWVARINRALEEGRLQLWQQPIVSCRGGDAGRHFEVLVRMRDTDGRVIPPGAFLPAAERYGLASKIDRWVIREVFRCLREHPEWADEVSVVAINLSGQSLSDEEFMAGLLELFEQGGVPAHKICFEITETAAVSNLTSAVQFISALKQRGCSFALDDFGSGVSSLGYLKTLPVDYLKIDGQFVRDIVVDRIDRAMVNSINDLAQVMGKKTIAEFVENDAILAELRAIGVDFAQGYGIARPSPLCPGGRCAPSAADAAGTGVQRRRVCE